jgi:putative resolvase
VIRQAIVLGFSLEWDNNPDLFLPLVGLQQLPKLICEDRVAEVAVTVADRLTRFGQAYLETLFTSFGVIFTVLEPDEEKTPPQELTEDLLSLITSFAGRLYGMRSHKQKALLACTEAVLHNP